MVKLFNLSYMLNKGIVPNTIDGVNGTGNLGGICYSQVANFTSSIFSSTFLTDIKNKIVIVDNVIDFDGVSETDSIIIEYFDLIYKFKFAEFVTPMTHQKNSGSGIMNAQSNNFQVQPDDTLSKMVYFYRNNANDTLNNLLKFLDDNQIVYKEDINKATNQIITDSIGIYFI